MFGSPGWYVTINGVLVLFLFVVSVADELFDQQATELTGFLCTRGYNGHFVKQQVQRARLLSREELLTPVQNRQRDIVLRRHLLLRTIRDCQTLADFSGIYIQCSNCLKNVERRLGRFRSLLLGNQRV